MAAHAEPSADGILAFWFGNSPEDVGEAVRRFQTWFRTEPDGAEDKRIRRAFAGNAEAAANGSLNPWLLEARSTLALILLLDQIPRHIYRGTARAYASDERAVAVAEAGIARGHDVRLSTVERIFFYIPFEHAESLALQDRCVRYYATLAEHAESGLETVMHTCVDGSRAHRDVIARFGRFPHRNAALGRESTVDEIAFAADHHGWGQRAER